MEAYDSDEATDFRPFFDMVIGVLFVLLILVAAQIFFQQVQTDAAMTEQARREAALRRADIVSFLGLLADRLNADGIHAVADAERNAVLFPLGDVMASGGGGLPEVLSERAGRLGGTLAALTTCVTEPRSTDALCAAFGRLHLETLQVGIRMGDRPAAAALPRDRFGVLAGSLLSASLFRSDPALIGASNASGARVVAFDAGLAVPAAPAVPPPATPGALDGAVVLDFAFD